MLAISPSAQAALAEMVRPAFAARLREPLVEKYPAILSRFPQHVQARMIGNMLDRARRWRISGQAASLAFCELMLKIAPNFDEEPDLRALLDRGQPTPDRALMTLPDEGPEQAWERARRNRSVLGLFIPPDLVGASPLDQTVAALPLVLFDRPPQPSVRVAVEQALPTVQTMGLRGLTDAPLVVCVCRAMWGVDFLRQPWAMVVARERFPPELVLAALRLRLAQDYGRFT